MGEDQRPVVHLYALNWNERPLLPFFFEHYRPFVDRPYMPDDDGSDTQPRPEIRSPPH